MPVNAATGNKTVSTKSIKGTVYHKQCAKGVVFNKEHTRKVINLTVPPYDVALLIICLSSIHGLEIRQVPGESRSFYTMKMSPPKRM